MASNPIIVRDEKARERVLGLVGNLDLTKAWEVIVRPYKRSRTVEQNKLMWEWLGVIAAETGHTAEELHEFAKQKFLPPVFIDIGSEIKEIRRTTTKLKVGEMSEYLDRLHAWATGELGIVLPLPDDRWAA